MEGNSRGLFKKNNILTLACRKKGKPWKTLLKIPVPQLRFEPPFFKHWNSKRTSPLAGWANCSWTRGGRGPSGQYVTSLSPSTSCLNLPANTTLIYEAMKLPSCQQSLLCNVLFQSSSFLYATSKKLIYCVCVCIHRSSTKRSLRFSLFF
jgi:hypothetical protein